MKMILNYSVELDSKYCPEKAKEIYLNAISNKKSYRIKNRNIEDQRIVFVAHNENIMWHNSFSPVVEMDFCDAASGTKIVANFRLRWSVQILMYIYILVALAFEIGMLISFQGTTMLLFPLVLPPALVVLAIIFACFGLRFSSKPVREFLEYISP